MGAWDVGTFDNDDASDWLYELEDTKGFDLLNKVLSAVTDEAKVLAEGECSVALAAAEVVAALKGKPSLNLPEEISKWVKNNSAEVSDDLLYKALEALILIKEESELKDFWVESENFEAWLMVLEDLQNRLCC
ncbi:MAG: DUF4259 domain-containing protein [Candidatus Hermodarchaeota archaeon]